MFDLLSVFRKNKILDFPGGINPPHMKSHSSQIPLKSFPLPDKLIIPLKQHSGPEGKLLITTGEKVFRGQPLTAGNGLTLPVHASTSGTIMEIAPHKIGHLSDVKKLSIILLPDGKDQWIKRQPLTDFKKYSKTWLLNRIHDMGIAGLGGAGFPTSTKLNTGSNKIHKVKTLIINGAECEPCVTADDRLMQEHACEIITGIKIICHILQPDNLFFGIEDNKQKAISSLKAALRDYLICKLRIIPTKYPSGGSKQLIKTLTGQEVTKKQHSSSVGITILNVGTIYAIKRAIINGEALTERVVTLTGEELKKPGNVWTRLGTPVRHLLTHAGFKFTPALENKPRVIMGGPLMGFMLNTLDVPIVKISNCLFVPSHRELTVAKPEQNCIHCGRCADVCPVTLPLPQLYWFCLRQEHDKARQHRLFDCIECGACSYVCPSNIPLVYYYRKQKIEIRAMENATQRATYARRRYEAKLERQEKEKKQTLSRCHRITITVDSLRKKIVADAIVRVRMKKKYIEKTKNK